MKYQSSLIHFSLLLTSAVTIGCAEDVASADIRTSGMYADFEAVASGDGSTKLKAELRVGGNDAGATYIKLTDEDDLIASQDEASASMDHQDNSGDVHWYTSVFDTDAEGTEFNIALERGEEDDNAPTSVATLPAPFAVELDGLSPGDDVARGSDVTITWEGDDAGDMDYTIDGPCIYAETGTTADDGSLTVDGADIKVTGVDEGEECIVTVTLERVNKGSVDDAYGEGGVFLAIQRRAITINSTPAPGEGGMGGSAN